MIKVIIILVLIYIALASIAYLLAKRRNAIFWSDISLPFVVIIFWVFVVAVGYGPQSLSQVIEVPMALAFSLLAFNFRVFILDKYLKKYERNSIAVLWLSLVFVLLLRTFMPLIPE